MLNYVELVEGQPRELNTWIRELDTSCDVNQIQR